MEKKVIQIQKESINKFKLLGDLCFFIDSGYDLKIEVTKGKKVVKKKVVKKVDGKGTKVEIKAKQLMKKYIGMRKKFYKSKEKMIIEKSQEKYFKKAAKIIIRNNTKIKIFMEAQIEGLNFVSGGKGIFPRASHLGSSTAEDRLLEYLRGKNKNVEIQITKEEKETSLNDNYLYKKRYNKLRKGEANLFEAKYVEACQVARKDVAQNLVIDYIKKLQKV